MEIVALKTTISGAGPLRKLNGGTSITSPLIAGEMATIKTATISTG